MKTINLFTIVSLFLLLSCNSEDDATTTSTSNNTTNSFDVEGMNYETNNGFLFLDNDTPFSDAFFFVFTDGIFIDQGIDEGTISTTATNAIVVAVENSTAEVPNESDVMILPNTTYTLNDESAAVTAINSFTDIVTFNGASYGEIDSATMFTLETTGSGTLTIDAINIDYVARNGTLDCTYAMTSDTGEVITGQFTGTFKIINSF